MTTSSLLSTPPLRITPPFAWRLKASERGIPLDVVRLIGEEGRDCCAKEGGAINGFVVS